MSFLNSVRMAPGARSALAVACGLALSSWTGAHAGESVLAPTVVTATRMATRVSELVADVTVIDRAQIEQAVGRSLASLLSDVPGIQISSHGGVGQSSSVFIRGGDAKQTQLLVDGVRYGSATLGEPSFDNIPLDQIDHIEIVRGPLASLYGADAASGVVQIFTRQGHAGFAPSASVTLGSDRFYSTSAGFSGGQDQLTYSLSASTLGTSGFSATNSKAGDDYNADRDGFTQRSLTARLGYKFNDAWRLEGTLMRSNGVSQFDDGTNPVGATPNTNLDLSSAVTGLTLSGRIGADWRTALRVSQSQDVSDGQMAYQSYNLGRYATKQTQVTWENQVATPLGMALVALEHLKQDVGSSTQDYTVSARTINALVLGLSGTSGAHDWQLSARQDNNSQFGNEAAGSVGYGFRLGSEWKLAGSMGTSFVAPSFNQLYFPDYGNPDLKPQRGFNKEINLSWAQADYEARLTRYDNRIHNFILTEQQSSSNLEGVRLSGWTLSGLIGQEVGMGRLYAGGSLDWLDAHDMSDDSKLVRRADKFAALRAGLKQGALSYEVSAKASAGAPDKAYDADFNPYQVRLAGYTLWGAAIRYAVAPDWSLAVRADNIGNHAYETAYGYNQPRNQVFVTLSYAPKSK
jgi:vitamin B12 transporter